MVSDLGKSQKTSFEEANMKFALSLAVILGLALVSQAAMVQISNGITADVTLATDQPSTYPALTAWNVTFQATAGISAVDRRFDGLMNQVWGFGGVAATPEVAAAGSAYASLTTENKKRDTHVVPQAGQLTIVRSPSEDLAGTYLAADTVDPDTGDILSEGDKTMAFGIASNPASFLFARIVLAGTNNAHFTGSVADGLSNKGTFSFDVVVPEPMTLSLLGAGALALIRRRR